jgi:hypothetical protein
MGMNVPNMKEKLGVLFHSGRAQEVTSMRDLLVIEEKMPPYVLPNVVYQWVKRQTIPDSQVAKFCNIFRIEADWLALSLEDFRSKLSDPRAAGGALWAKLTASVVGEMKKLAFGFRVADESRGPPRIGKVAANLPEVLAGQEFAIEFIGTSEFKGWHVTIVTHDGSGFFSLCPSPEVPALTIGSSGPQLYPPLSPNGEMQWLHYLPEDSGEHWLFLVLARHSWSENLADKLGRDALAPHETEAFLDELAAECLARPREDWALAKQQFRVIRQPATGIVVAS